MHQTVFFGYGMLIALGTTLVLGRSRDLYLPNLMTALTLTLGGAGVGGMLMGFGVHGQFGVASMGAVFGGGIMAVATIPYFFPGEKSRDAYDVVISACVLGLLTTRVGCHFNGCDVGATTDWFWGIVPHLPHRETYNYSQTVHPFPWLIIVPTALLFVATWVRSKRAGMYASTIAIGYLVVRFFAEFFRTPSRFEWVGLHLNQWLVIVALIATVIWSRQMLRDEH